MFDKKAQIKVITSTKDHKFELAELEPLKFSEFGQNINFPNREIKKSIKIDESQKSHKILGIGYSFEHTSCQNLLRLNNEDRRRTIEAMVDPKHGAGMNLWRICIGTSDFTGTEWYNYLDEPPQPNVSEEELDVYLEQKFSIEKDKKYIIPILKIALEINPDIKFFASPWSPPGWMKDTGVMCGGKLLRKYWRIYAEYLAKFVQEYENEGISIHAITVQNEPLHNVKTMPTCKWDMKGTEERDFIKSYLGPIFKKYNLKTEIWCFDHNFDFLGWLNILKRPSRYPQTILDDPDALKYVSGVAFHHYAAFGFSDPKMMIKLRKKYPNVPFYFTEGSLMFFFGATRLPRYIKYGASSVNGWVPFIDDRGDFNNGPFKTKSSMITLHVPEMRIEKTFDYYMYAQYSKFIQRNATVIDIFMPKMRGFESLAVLNPNQDIILVLTNKRSKSKEINIIHRDKSAKMVLKPNSITTLIWKTQ